MNVQVFLNLYRLVVVDSFCFNLGQKVLIVLFDHLNELG